MQSLPDDPHAAGAGRHVRPPVLAFGHRATVRSNPTPAPSPIGVARLGLRLSYSRDEEYVEALAWCGDQRFDLGARAHHYLLLVLARRRLADRAAGVGEADQGWIRQDELVSSLRMTDNHIYISIHRARAQLGSAGVANAAGLVERRKGTRQLRLGVRVVELVPLDAPR